MPKEQKILATLDNGAKKHGASSIELKRIAYDGGKLIMYASTCQLGLLTSHGGKRVFEPVSIGLQLEQELGKAISIYFDELHFVERLVHEEVATLFGDKPYEPNGRRRPLWHQSKTGDVEASVEQILWSIARNMDQFYEEFEGLIAGYIRAVEKASLEATEGQMAAGTLAVDMGGGAYHALSNCLPRSAEGVKISVSELLAGIDAPVNVRAIKEYILAKIAGMC